MGKISLFLPVSTKKRIFAAGFCTKICHEKNSLYLSWQYLSFTSG